MLKDYMNKTLNIGGMTCVNCENKIEKGLKNIDGIITVNVFYSTGTVAITYDSSKISIIEIEEAVVMLGYSIISPGQAVEKKKVNLKIAGIAGVILVAVFGVFLFSNGTASAGVATASVTDGTQFVTTTLSSEGYEPINVQAGIPVQWTIKADESAINGCNNKIIIPEYNIEKSLEPGDNIIEFTPTKSGTVAFSCWMGMITSQIFVYDDLEDQSQVLPAGDASNLPNCCN